MKSMFSCYFSFNAFELLNWTKGDSSIDTYQAVGYSASYMKHHFDLYVDGDDIIDYKKITKYPDVSLENMVGRVVKSRLSDMTPEKTLSDLVLIFRKIKGYGYIRLKKEYEYADWFNSFLAAVREGTFDGQSEILSTIDFLQL